MSENEKKTTGAAAVSSADLLAQKYVDDALARVKENNQSLASKGEVTLTVQLSTEEEADELFTWLYSEVKPMKSTLVGISWDSITVTGDEINDIIQSLENLKG